MSLTPPNDQRTAYADEKGKIQWAKQKKIGENAIVGDLLGKGGKGGVFRVRKMSTFKKAEKWQQTLGKDMAGMQHAIWATKDGRVFGVEHNLYQPDASISTMKAHHNKYRNCVVVSALGEKICRLVVMCSSTRCSSRSSGSMPT